MTKLDRTADLALKWGGLIVAAGSAYFSARYGLISAPDDMASGLVLALVLIACCFCWAYLPAIAYGLWSERKYAAVGVCAVATAVAASFDYVSTFGSLATIRGVDQHEARIQKTVYDDGRSQINETRQRLKEAEAAKARLEREASWLVARTPESFDGEIAAATLARDNEAKRGGCGPICEAKTRELAELQAKRAMAVAYVAKRQQIANFAKLVASYRDQSAKAPPKPAASEFQNTAIASAVSFSLAPSATQVAWANLGISMLSGWFFLLFPMTANLLRKIMGTDVEVLPNPPAERAAPEPANLPSARDATSLAQAAPAGGTNHMMAAVLQQGEDPFEALRKIASQMQSKEAVA